MGVQSEYNILWGFSIIWGYRERVQHIIGVQYMGVQREHMGVQFNMGYRERENIWGFSIIRGYRERERV
ncbi:hypothetical protein XELAEV_18040952mg [Xenopus laevis]|uniref:Uncharacterized protein n=1 Tax=Xenopus laevis TaxID=8355 RepID=A0A974CAK1_XENLA|nr:hypothetical protein XELAEV_18040952mg [Xenopus laevis]